MIDHGTISGYFSDGCRCDECRAAAAKYRKAYRAGRRIRDEKVTEIRHGTNSGYTYHRCRCQICRDFMAAQARRQRREKGANPKIVTIGCSVEGCERKHMAKGLCRLHYYRVKASGEPGPLHPVRAAWGEGCVTPEGYRIIAGVLQHRSVMEAHIGRPLIDGENIHHMNGDRADNRIENLELWSTSQPAGQRVIDKLRWAREIVALYGEMEADGLI